MTDLLLLCGVMASCAVSTSVLQFLWRPAQRTHSEMCLWKQGTPAHDRALDRLRGVTVGLIASQAVVLVCLAALLSWSWRVGGSHLALYVLIGVWVILAVGYPLLWRAYLRWLHCYDLEAMQREVQEKVAGMMLGMAKARAAWRSN